MGLTNKLVAPLMLSAAIMSAISGCTTTASAWKYDKTNSTPIGIPKTINKNTGTKTETEKKFDISDFLLTGEVYQARVTESLNQ
jgi:hypothetical protein